MKLFWRIWVAVGRSVIRSYWHAVYSGYREAHSLPRSFRFNGYGIQLYGDGSFELGCDSYVGEISTLQAVRGCRIRIGQHCMLSHNVRIYTETAVADSDFISGVVLHKRGDVIIEDGVWIGANAFIGPGVTIARNSVVGANSVVTKSIPANEIWGGVPARLIRRKTLVDEVRRKEAAGQ